MALGDNARLLVFSGVFVAAAVFALSLLQGVARNVTDDLVALSEPQVPCALAVPTLAELHAGLGLGSGSDEDLATQTAAALCEESDVNWALNQLYLGTYGAQISDEAELEHAVCSKSELRGTLLGELEAEWYVDPLLRLTRAYMAANAAFVHYEPRSHHLDDDCLFNKHPFGTDCTQAQTVRDELAAAAHEGVLNAEEPLPEHRAMLYRLMALATVAHYDHANNFGRCFSNRAELNATRLCETAYADFQGSAASPPPATSPPPPSPSAPLVGTYSFETFYLTGGYDLCVEDPVRVPPPSPPPLDAVAYADAAWHDAAAKHCVRTHEFGAHDTEMLFGVPDFQRPPPTRVRDTEIIGWLAGMGFRAMSEGWYDDRRKGLALSSPQRDAMLYAGFRAASTLVWVCAALCCAGFWLARGALPFLAAVIPAARGLASGQAPPQIVKPGFSLITFLAVAFSAQVAVYAFFGDPWSVHAYLRPACDGTHVYTSSAGQRLEGFFAALLVGGAAALSLVYDIFFRTRGVRIPRASSGLLQLALLGVCAGIVFDVLLVVESADAWTDEVTGNADNETRLSALARQLRTDVDMLVHTCVWFSAALGALTCRWAFVKQGPLYKGVWALSTLLAAAVPVLVRLRDTEAELNEARDEGVYGTRVAAFWATVGTAGALALALFFFWRDAAFAAITRSARTGTTVKATSRMQADARREWNRLRGITTGAGAGEETQVLVQGSKQMPALLMGSIITNNAV